MTAKSRYSFPRTRKLWSPAAKEAVVAQALGLRERGQSWRAIALAVGTKAENVRRWCARGAGASLPVGVDAVSAHSVRIDALCGAARVQETGFVEVAVVPVTAVPAPMRPTVVSPAGYRVEGLDLAGVVTVLRALS